MSSDQASRSYSNASLVEALGERSLVLVGMMGAGKTTVGRRLAGRLGIQFIDVDAEIERAAGQSISDIFATHGEEAFRDGERKVIARLLEGGPAVLATGGGAFINAETRGNIAKAGISVWMKADFDTLMRRVKRRKTRPLLEQGDPEQVMRDLLAVRDPVYGEADVTVTTRDVPHEVMVEEIVEAVARYMGLVHAQA